MTDTNAPRLVLGLALTALVLLLPVAARAEEPAKLDTQARHASGLVFRHPSAWKTEIREGEMVVLPPNPNPLGEAPVYRVAVQPKGALTRPDAPELVGMIEEHNKRATPYLVRQGGAQKLPVAGGDGVVLTWEGKSPAGLVERARAYVALLGDHVVFLTARSGRFVLRQHESVLDAMFATFRMPTTRSPFPGTYVGDGMTVVLEPGGERLTGRIVFKGQNFALSAKATGERLEGTFRSGEHEFPFTATLADADLTLVTGGATYRLRREGAPATPAAPVNPLAAGPSPGAAPPTPAPTGGVPAALSNLGPVQPDPKREWTIVAYIDGDNDLEPFALRDLVEMEFGLPSQGIEIIVLLDRAKDFDTSAGDWTDARVYRVRSDRNATQIASEVLCQPGELNMGDAAVLGTFLGAALETFPARNHMLLLWDHGGGWSSMANDHDAPGTPEGHDHLDLPELREGIEAGLKKAGLEKLQIVGFDMCLMAQLETAAELEGLADVMVASQAIEPGDGWPFNELLPALGKQTLGSRRIAQEIVRCYSRFYDEREASAATLSALDLTQVKEVVDCFDAVLKKLLPTVETQWPALSRSVFFAEAYAGRTDIRKGPNALASVDLLDTIKRMRHALTPFPAEAEYRRLVDVMDRFVIASHTSRRHRLSNGVALYAPVHGEMSNPEYARNRLATRCVWPKFLAALHGAQARHRSAPSFSNLRVTDQKGRPVASVEAQMDHRLSFTLDGKNLAWTQVWFGRDDPASGAMVVLSKMFVVDPDFYKRRNDAVADVVDLIMPKYADGPNQLYQDLNGLVFRVGDGQRAHEATVDASALEDLDHLRVPVLLKHPSVGEVGATILFDARWWQVAGVLAEIPQPDGNVMLRQVDPPAETQVTLLLETVKQSGETGYTRGATFGWGKGPELLVDACDAGTWRAVFVAETIGGEAAVASLEFPIKESPWITRVKQDTAQLQPATLAGTWDHYLIGEKFTPSGLVFELTPHEKDRDLVVAKVKSTKRADVDIRQVIWPDARLLPTLRFFEYDDKGHLIGFYLATFGFGAREGKPTLFYKMADVTRISAALVKRDGGAVPAAGTPTAPTQPAQPAPPANPLVGQWDDGAGNVLVCSADRYELYSMGELMDQGQYAIRGNQFVARSADGETSTYAIRVTRDTLIVQDEDGSQLVFRRVR